MYHYYLLKKRDFAFNPDIDLKAVDPSGAVDLRKAYENGAVDGNVVIIDEHFNGCADPSTIMPRPKDQFERWRQGEYVKESLKAAKSVTEPVTPTGDTN